MGGWGAAPGRRGGKGGANGRPRGLFRSGSQGPGACPPGSGGPQAARGPAGGAFPLQRRLPALAAPLQLQPVLRLPLSLRPVGGQTGWAWAGQLPSDTAPPSHGLPALQPPRGIPGLTCGLGRAARGADTCSRAACLRRSAAFSLILSCSCSTRSSWEGALGAAAFLSSHLGGRQGRLRRGPSNTGEPE